MIDLLADQRWLPFRLVLALLLAISVVPLAAQEAGEEEPAEEAPDERLKFSLPLDPESGGGTVEGRAVEVEYREDGVAVLDGDVEITYQDLKIRAERIEFNSETDEIVAVGEVIFDEGPRRLSGSQLEFNLSTELGRMLEARGSVASDYFFEGAEIAKVGEDQYRIVDAVFTSCTTDVPAWSFRAGTINLTVDGYARIKHATLRAKKMPFFYFPYMLWPAQTDRASGFLVPKPGYSSRRGASLGLAYYWAMGRSYDATFNVDFYAGGRTVNPQVAETTTDESFLAFGTEFRYRPSETTSGTFEGYWIDDPEFADERWRIRYNHQSRSLPGGFRGVIAVEDVSDFDFYQDYERRFDRNSRRQVYSQGYLTKNWGSQSFNVLFDQRETFVSANRTIELRQLPEVEYKLRSTQLGKAPVYLQMRSSLHYLDVDRSDRRQATYGRADIFPELTVPIRAAPWFSFSFTVGGRYTWYEDSFFTSLELSESPSDSDFRSESLDRFLTTASAEIVGPSFSRIFDINGKKIGKLKHVIEPRITYGFIDDFDERDRVPLFDEIDNIRGLNVARASIINRFLAKPADESLGSAREILSFEVFQDYSVDSEKFLQRSSDGEMTKSSGPLRTLLRYNPSQRTSLKLDVAYNTLFSELQSTSLSSSIYFSEAFRFGVRWTTRTNAELGTTRSNQLRVSSSIGLVPDKLRLTSSVNYDIERELLQQQRHLLDYIGSCYRLSLEFSDFETTNRKDTEYRFLVTFKNVGTFLDITGGRSETL